MKYTVAISAIIVTISITTLPLVWGGESSGQDVAAVTMPIYKEECSSCHMAYPPGLLPARSWLKVMAGLEDHFGDNAELDAETQTIISAYLQKNSADHSSYRRSHKFSRSIRSNNTPLRITQIPYFQRKHDEIPTRLVAGNEGVKSFSNCQACHSKAEAGNFNEDNVRIPGFGRWDD